jgi:hypothetical protein
MEMGFPRGAATLVAMGEGSVSMYFSSGGGIIGGGEGHESVRGAGLAFVKASADFLHLMEPADSFPYPPANHVRFYVLTPERIYTYLADQNELGNNRDPLGPLFHFGDRTITELRLVSNSKGVK